MLGFSPEREDPGKSSFFDVFNSKDRQQISPAALDAMSAFYSAFIVKIVPVSSMATAEAVKILENTFRAVNMTLVNELKIIFEEMQINIFEVIEAATTKPFGFMPFYPAPAWVAIVFRLIPFTLLGRLANLALQLGLSSWQEKSTATCRPMLWSALRRRLMISFIWAIKSERSHRRHRLQEEC